MIILSIVAILLAGALLALMLRITDAPEPVPELEGPVPQPDPSRRPFPYDHEQYPGSV
ncbi:MAG: hypothetical protein IT304_04735 [Dehalococcoidia bacterium]|nr:hypothetical protein [Dehalococcoidia bacterium]